MLLSDTYGRMMRHQVQAAVAKERLRQLRMDQTGRWALLVGALLAVAVACGAGLLVGEAAAMLLW